MLKEDTGCLLRIFIGDKQKKDGHFLYDWLVQKARELGLAGATVLRAIGGFGADRKIQLPSIFHLSQELPVIIEIVDSEDKIEQFFPIIDEVVSEGLVTVNRVQVKCCHSQQK